LIKRLPAMSGYTNTSFSAVANSIMSISYNGDDSTLSIALNRLIEQKSSQLNRPPFAPTLIYLVEFTFDKLIPQLNEKFTRYYGDRQSSDEFKTLPFLVLKFLFTETRLYPLMNNGVRVTEVNEQGNVGYLYDETCALSDRTVDSKYLSLVNDAMSLYEEFELDGLSEQIIQGIQEWLGANRSNTKSSNKR
jgi:hypothetical protein